MEKTQKWVENKKHSAYLASEAAEDCFISNSRVGSVSNIPDMSPTTAVCSRFRLALRSLRAF